MAQSPQTNSQQQQNQPPQTNSQQQQNQPPSKTSIISSWMIVLFVLTTIIVNIWATATKQELALIIVSSILTGLGILLVLIQVFPQILRNLQSTWRPVALSMLIVICVTSVSTNIYLLVQNGHPSETKPARTATIATPRPSVTPTDPTTIAQIFTKPVSWADNLDGIQQDGGWDIISNSAGDGCTQQNHYQITVNTNDAVIPCFSNKTVTNFALEVNMTVLKGDGSGGLIFRAGQPASINVPMYRLDVNPSNQTFDFLEQQNNAARTNPFCDPNNHQYCWTARISKNQKNTVGVVGIDHTFYIFINGDYVSTIKDSLLSSGLIGLFATKHKQNTIIEFDSLELWYLQ